MSRKRPQVDAARLALMLTELRLPTMKAVWPEFTDRADQEGWPAALLQITERRFFRFDVSTLGYAV